MKDNNIMVKDYTDILNAHLEHMVEANYGEQRVIFTGPNPKQEIPPTNNRPVAPSIFKENPPVKILPPTSPNLAYSQDMAPDGVGITIAHASKVLNAGKVRGSDS